MDQIICRKMSFFCQLIMIINTLCKYFNRFVHCFSKIYTQNVREHIVKWAITIASYYNKMGDKTSHSIFLHIPL